MRSDRITGYDRVLLELRSLTGEMSKLAREHIAKALDLLNQQTAEVDWRASDNEIDKRRDQIVSRSFEIISLQQPRPQDLRWILGFQRVAQEIERIADYACDVAEINELKGDDDWPEEILKMAGQLLSMYDYSVSVLNQDKKLDSDLNEQDDLLDHVYAELKQELVKKDRQSGDFGLIMIMARTLERMGDHVVNIAETLLYVQTGKRRINQI